MAKGIAQVERNGSAGLADILSEKTNLATPDIAADESLMISFTLEGKSSMIFHRWSNEAVAEKAAAKKGSAQKKSDNVESYVYRDTDGLICVPGIYVHAAMCIAAKSFQDPRSPRKSAMELFKAAALPMTELAPLYREKNGEIKTFTDWEELHQCRVQVQRNSITRSRPMFYKGWKADFEFLISAPEYIPSEFFFEVLERAGKLVGLADFRPTYGRYRVTNYTCRTAI